MTRSLSSHRASNTPAHCSACTYTHTQTQRQNTRVFSQVQYGYVNLEDIFRDSTQMSLASLTSLLFAKIAATSVCVGGGLIGGLFAPSLFLGALVGDIMSHMVVFNTGACVVLKMYVRVCVCCSIGGLFAPLLILGALVGDIMSHMVVFNTGVCSCECMCVLF